MAKEIEKERGKREGDGNSAGTFAWGEMGIKISCEEKQKEKRKKKLPSENH